MAEYYKQFAEQFNKYIQYSQGSQDAYSGRLSPKLSDLALSLTPEKSPVYIEAMKNPRTLAILFQKGAEQKEKEIKEMSKQNLEGILSGLPKEDLAIGVQIAKPKDSYSGKNSGLYAEIAKSQKKVRLMVESLQSKDPKKKVEAIKKVYAEKYKNDKNSLEIMNTLIDLDQRFDHNRYVEIINETQTELTKNLKGNEIGYLKSNLEGEDFIKFYMNVLSQKEQLKKAQEKSGSSDDDEGE
jgi:hypothetical protein